MGGLQHEEGLIYIIYMFVYIYVHIARINK